VRFLDRFVEIKQHCEAGWRSHGTITRLLERMIRARERQNVILVRKYIKGKVCGLSVNPSSSSIDLVVFIKHITWLCDEKVSSAISERL